MQLSKNELVEELWDSDPRIKKIMKSSSSLKEARDRFFDYLNDLERDYFNIYSDNPLRDLHILEKNNAKECIRVLKNVIRTENEELTGYSALNIIYDLARYKNVLNEIDKGFLVEFIYLIRGINGQSGHVTETYYDPSLEMDGRQAAINRSLYLDTYSMKMKEYFKKYASGLDPKIIEKTIELKNDIMAYFGATESDWNDYTWHMEHIFKDVKTISDLVRLEDDEIEGLEYAERHNIPFQITPFYLSLFNKEGRSERDRAIRAQVIPSVRYCKNVVNNRLSGLDLDFMGEKSTSPIEGITRRYPQILILKPYDSCPQICVYCQRNWEIKSIDDAKVTKGTVEKAIQWIKDNESITEVLVTGGDPFTLNNQYINWLLGEICAIDHVERIRIGTRTIITMPFRINDELIEILKKCQVPGKREVCIVTHFEHPTEVTPETMEAVQKIRRAGISVYNQQVFTYYNSRKFESALLRKVLKISGVDPYYSFNTKGKEETIDFRVPIARIEQERKEEARLLPGLERTDEAVFNVPKLGKSHLRAWQDHEVIMITPDGMRAYRFYPWESKLAVCDAYVYTDVSIYEYLKRLMADNEDINEYKYIWYYF
ncbi:KamA family radical SAM protein [Methanocella sp. CWC-04]|uniref:KamA family radical SAM protein n=2 Tax=Methanooceanicella nereidis TaxID=2052831 RepID=A0AAP2W7Z5_9EURY|nr:KamA family radical SAM protein [Methanocella sp. CWC-04]